MPRYFIRLSYNGTHYCGWQRQDNAPSVQQSIEDVLSQIYTNKVPILGCGRTDAGVHAKNYIAHLDHDSDITPQLAYKMNRMLNKDIVIHDIRQVKNTAHARFDATSRSYQYIIRTEKDPFNQEMYYHYNPIMKADFAKMQSVASMIKEYSEFFPFCKSNSDALTMKCNIMESRWKINVDKTEFVFEITANRFLRGMVRLIVGMCINVGLGKLTIDEVRSALDTQKRLPTPYSVPACGLYLCDVKYPNIELDAD